jgi:Tfp pilus assembly protein PilV
MKQIRKKGMGMLEILIGSSIIVIGLVAIIQSYNYYLHIALTNTPAIQASYLLEESVEAMRSLRDQSWTSNIASLSTSNTYYLSYNTTTNKWSTTGTNAFIDRTFERKITVASVYRDASNDIVSSGTLDTNTRKITATVSWQNQGATTSKSVSTYLTNLFSN